MNCGINNGIWRFSFNEFFLRLSLFLGSITIAPNSLRTFVVLFDSSLVSIGIISFASIFCMNWANSSSIRVFLAGSKTISTGDNSSICPGFNDDWILPKWSIDISSILNLYKIFCSGSISSGAGIVDNPSMGDENNS